MVPLRVNVFKTCLRWNLHLIPQSCSSMKKDVSTQNEEKKVFFLLYPSKLQGLQLTVSIITINYV